MADIIVAPIVDEVVEPGATDITTNVETDAVPIIIEVKTGDVETTATPIMAPTSEEPFVYTNKKFSIGPSDRSLLIEYANHMEYRLWLGEVYIFFI